MPQKHCKKAKENVWIHYKPSLFQHIGTHSSLKGKVQKLKVGALCYQIFHTSRDFIFVWSLSYRDQLNNLY